MADEKSEPHKVDSTRDNRLYSFKRADTAQEFDDIHRLLYRTFVVEIPRYADPGTDYLVDKFHERNIYFVALRRDHVCGMIAVHDKPPFSVAAALEDVRALERQGSRLLEARILAVEPEERFGLVFAGLTSAVYEYAKATRYQQIIISGIERRQSMYERMGFRAFGPPVFRGNDQFVPMSLDLSGTSRRVNRDLERWNRREKLRVTRTRPGGASEDATVHPTGR